MEHKKQKVASFPSFLKRFLRYGLFAFALIAFSLLIGVVGYRIVADLSWIDSLYMASMILTGMGPTAEITSVSGKVFSSVYAIYSGVAFLSISAVLFAPIIHRILHILHVEDDNQKED